MSYGLTCNLLAEVLPLDRRLSTRSVRRKLHRVATRLEYDLGDEVGLIGGTQDRLPEPGDRPPPPMTVGFDGGYVHAREGSNRKPGWIEVMVDKSIPDKGDVKCFAPKCFAMVHTLTPNQGGDWAQCSMRRAWLNSKASALFRMVAIQCATFSSTSMPKVSTG